MAASQERVSWTRASVVVTPPDEPPEPFSDVRLFVVPDSGGGYPQARIFERPGPSELRSLSVERMEHEGRNRLILLGVSGELWDALDVGCGC